MDIHSSRLPCSVESLFKGILAADIKVLRSYGLQSPAPSLDSTSLCQLKVVLRSLSRAAFLFHKDDGKFVQLAVTDPGS